MLNEIKTLLGVEEQEPVLAKLNLENGTVLESEDFKNGSDVFILTEDEKVALPVGEYELEDGRFLEVAEEGIISEIKAEKEPKDEEDEKSDDKEEMAYATKEELAEVVTMVEEIKSMIEKMGDKKEEEKEEEMAELKENLSEASADPIKHSPEKTTETKFNLYSQQRPLTTLDRVMEGISQIN